VAGLSVVGALAREVAGDAVRDFRRRGGQAFFAPTARERVGEAVRAVELETSAELVVTLRPISGHYRHTDYLVGALAALALLCVFLYHPEPFEYDFLPLELGAIFGLGALISAYFGPLRRALTSKALRAQSVRRAAREAFVDLGVSRTRARTGVLVYVSMFERRVEVVADVGVDAKAVDAASLQLVSAVEGSLFRGPSFDGFVAALRRLGPALAAALPRDDDDVNELADEVRS
jgi:putative membrane protein